MNNQNTIDSMSELAEQAKTLGAFKASVLPVEQIPFDAGLRKACEANYCGNYGKNWTCPPDVGNVDELIAQAKGYQYALVYQTVSTIEDSYDFEGMVAALARHRDITDGITAAVRQQANEGMLQLSAGGCIICDKCAKKDNQPCRYPDKAVASLEAYGIYVAKLAELANMNYINGKNTVTYFGAYLFK
jgi:predicted metal-binding protein